MNLSIERVSRSEDEKILRVHDIIKESGRHMYELYNLTHWKKPYPIESIRKDCDCCEVYLVKDKDNEIEDFVNTFQIEFLTDKESDGKDIAIIKKFATSPSHEGKGIGKFSIKFIEEYCKSKGVSKILLDVYNKSIHAIEFYKKRGFNIIRTDRTRNFEVLIMQMDL